MTTTRAEPAPTPDDLLKAAIAGRPVTARARIPRPRVPKWLRRHARLAGVAGAALALGAAAGAGATALSPHRGRAPDTGLATVRAGLEADRRERARLTGEIAGLQQAVTDLRASTDAARKDAAARGTAVTDRLAQVDRAVATKLTALGERIEQAEREQAARVAGLAGQIERRAAVAPAARQEPTQTGSLAEPRPAEARPTDPRAPEAKSVEAKAAKLPADERPAAVEGWALRDVYDGVAILENRRRRLVQVGAGDTVPGVGLVQAVEHRGRGWVVVTRQGLITPQPW